MDISIYNFKNYYNRSGKGFTELSSYASMLLENYENIQFNPNDGVSTNLILDMSEGLDPDYLIVSDVGAIVSRWYVMECKRTRLSQYRLTLKRDVIVDYKDVIASSSAFIERGYLPDTDPGIYNSEPVAMNQIKNQEVPLPDASNCNWIVGYFASANTIDGEALDPDVSGDYSVSGAITLNKISDWQYYGLTLSGGAASAVNNFNLRVRIANPLPNPNGIYGYWEYYPLIEPYEEYYLYSGVIYDSRFELTRVGTKPDPAIGGKSLYYQFMNLPLGKYTTINNWLKDSLNVRDDINFNDLFKENNKIYYDSYTNKYWQVNIIKDTQRTIEGRLNGTALYNSSAYANTAVLINNVSDFSEREGNIRGNEILWTGTYTYYQVKLNEITGQTTSTKISTTRRKLVDAPYCMFCIPYQAVKIDENDKIYISGEYIVEQNTLIQTNPSEMLNIAQKIAEKYSGAGWLYDIQILPYCPVPKYISQNNENTIDLSTAAINVDYNWIVNANNQKIGAIIWAANAIGRFNIPISLTVNGSPKVSNCCDVYRLVAPNYNASFEFSVAKNNGVEYFEVEYEYKPHNPYIHINPLFKNLYGDDFDDARGLICTGDYSLSIVSNAWTTYQLQNVNFQKIFDRQIENMDVNHTYDLIGNIAGTIRGVSSGAFNGVMAGTGGGPAGMIAGGIAGGVMGAVGGIADIALGEARYAEQKDFSKDMFAYNLQNVQALPNTLAKVSALTPTNKQFPFIEIYKPTELERQLFIQYLELKGMNVGRVDTIENYIIDDKYLKAQIIRMPAIKGDNHISQAIAAEIDKGVYW